MIMIMLIPQLTINSFNDYSNSQSILLDLATTTKQGFVFFSSFRFVCFFEIATLQLVGLHPIFSLMRLNQCDLVFGIWIK